VTGGDAAKGPDDTFRHLYDVLRDGQEEATGPSARCRARGCAVARGIIDAAGFGPNFLTF
jgi:hypothetical protein